MKKILVLLAAIICVREIHCDAITWTTPPATLSSTSDNSSNPQVVVDVNGNTTVAWLENGNIQVSMLPLSGSWSTPLTLSSSPSSSSPVLAVDPTGTVTALWIEGSTSFVMANQYSGSWGTAVALSSAVSSSPALAVDYSTDLVAVWVAGGNVQSSTNPSGSGWQVTPDTLGPGDSPQVSIGNNQQTVAVWHYNPSGTDEIYSANKQIGVTSWTAAGAISDISVNSVVPQIAVDANGNAVAIWYSFTSGTPSSSIYSNVLVQSASFPMSGSWGTPESISNIGVYNPTSLVSSIKMDVSGNALAMWTTSATGNTFNIQSALKPFSQAWLPAVTIKPYNVYANFVNQAITPNGYVLAAFNYLDPTSSIIVQTYQAQTNTTYPGQGRILATLSDGTVDGYSVTALTSNNSTLLYAAAAWLDFNGSFTTVQATTGSSSIALSIPNGSINMVQNYNDYGFFQEYYNTVSWSASPDSNVVSYNIFRDGLLIANVPATTLQYVDDNRFAGEAITYGISALMNDGSESIVITQSF